MNRQRLEGRDARNAKRLSDLKPGEDYLDLKCLPGTMPDHSPRLEFLQACERLDIPREKWPSFDGEPLMLLEGPAQLPGTPPMKHKTMGITTRPFIVRFEVVFDLCADDHRTFKTKLNSAWQSYCEENLGKYLKQATRTKEHAIHVGLLTHRREYREGKNTIPVSLRYELAVRRHCGGTSWGKLRTICRDQYSEDRIRKSVEAIFLQLGLKTRS